MTVESWLGVTSDHTLCFFLEGLQEVVGDRAPARAELYYNASILAHYALTSTAAGGHDLQAPADLRSVFELFVLDRSQHTDPALMETAGAQCLLLTGFFAAQQRHRHSLRWFADVGGEFFAAAGRRHADARRARLLWTMAERFEFWRQAQEGLAAHLRNDPVLTVRSVA